MRQHVVRDGLCSSPPRQAGRSQRWAVLLACACAAPLVSCGSSEPSESALGDRDTDTDTSAAFVPGGSVGDAPYVDPSSELFDAVKPPELYLTLSEEALTALEAEPTVYQRGALRYVSVDSGEESTLEEIGVRLKGRASFAPLAQKASFKLKFGEFVAGQRFQGLRRLTLNNMAQDPSAMRERLGYAYLAQAGIVAPRSNHARVYLNGEYYGLFTNVESLDEAFLERHFDPPDGNLYDTSNDEYFVDILPSELQWFELETNQEENDRSDLEALAEVLAGPQENFPSDAEALLDLDQFLRVGGAQAVLADWDGYFGASNNYELYHDTAGDRFVLLPWGIDQTFNYLAGAYTMLDYTIDGSGSERPNGVVFTKCKADAECYAEYLEQVREALAVFESMDLMGLLERILPEIEGAWQEDPRNPHSEADHQRALEGLREFIAERGDLVRAQLEE